MPNGTCYSQPYTYELWHSGVMCKLPKGLASQFERTQAIFCMRHKWISSNDNHNEINHNYIDTPAKEVVIMNDHGEPKESNRNRWVSSSSRLSHRSVLGFAGGSEQQFYPQSLDFMKIGNCVYFLRRPSWKVSNFFFRSSSHKILVDSLMFSWFTKHCRGLIPSESILHSHLRQQKSLGLPGR